MSTRSLSARTLVLGDEVDIGVAVLHDQYGSDLTGLTGFVSIYNSLGVVVLADGDMTVTGTTSQKATFRLTTGPGNALTTAGTYRAVYKFTTVNTEVQHFEQQITVRGNPYMP